MTVLYSQKKPVSGVGRTRVKEKRPVQSTL